MTEDLFRQLAVNMGEIEANDIKHIIIREQYGFVDLLEPKAKKLIDNLNGIEYNGIDLPIERASTVNKRRTQEDSSSSDTNA